MSVVVQRTFFSGHRFFVVRGQRISVSSYFHFTSCFWLGLFNHSESRLSINSLAFSYLTWFLPALSLPRESFGDNFLRIFFPLRPLCKRIIWWTFGMSFVFGLVVGTVQTTITIALQLNWCNATFSTAYMFCGRLIEIDNADDDDDGDDGDYYDAIRQ